MSNDAQSSSGTVQMVDSIDLPAGWGYDPDWVWPGTEAAVYHDTYWGTVNGEDESGYIIEVQDTRVVLYEIDEFENNNPVQEHERDDIPEAITELIETAERQLQPATERGDSA